MVWLVEYGTKKNYKKSKVYHGKRCQVLIIQNMKLKCERLKLLEKLPACEELIRGNILEKSVLLVLKHVEI